jgi:hypothetical protein
MCLLLAGVHRLPKFLLVHRYRNQHEARETYKTLRDQNIGNAAASAILYMEWAAFEMSTGRHTVPARGPWT